MKGGVALLYTNDGLAGVIAVCAAEMVGLGPRQVMMRRRVKKRVREIVCCCCYFND